MKNKKQPLVSVIMPVYNAGSYLKPALDSIMKQTYQNFEVIIINDASTDKSGKVLDKYAAKYPEKVKVFHMKRNLNRGGDTCANEALAKAKGKYIARMDADDIAHKTRLEKQVAFLQENPQIDLVGTNAYVINNKGVVTGEKLEPTTPQEIYNAYFTFHPIIHPSAMYRRIIMGKPFEYQIKYSANNDYYSFFKLLCKGARFANLDEKLMFYRIHNTNDTFVHIKKKFMNTIRIRMEMFFKFHYNPTAKQLLTNIIQLAAALLLPERITKQLYLISKGIVKVENPLSLIKENTVSYLKNIFTLRFVARRFSTQKLG